MIGHRLPLPFRGGAGGAGHGQSLRPNTAPAPTPPLKGKGLILATLAVLFLTTPALARRQPPPPPPSAGGLIDNVNGYTIGGHGEVARFTGLLIGKDGRVARLLSRNDPRPERLDFRLDGKGRTLLPGLIDAHGHLLDLGFSALQLNLADTASLTAAQRAIAAYAGDHPNPAWIRGFGWNQEKWGLGRYPTAADIDAVVGDRPVILDRVDEHAVLVNSAAMAAAGISAKTLDPPGGHIERDASGRPTGLFVDAARALVEAAVPPPLPRDIDAALTKAQDILLGFGLTSVDDMRTTPLMWNALRRMGDAGRLRERILCYADGIDALVSIAGVEPTPWLYDGRLKMQGLKLFADGALGSRGAWLKAPYADAPGVHPKGFLHDAKLQNLMSRAAMDGFQVAVHAIGDAANAQVLDAIDELSDTYKGDRRWRIEHAQIVDPADLPRFARHGIVASMQPTHETGDWRMAEARMGDARLQGAYAWGTMLKQGVPLAFGSDFPVESPNPFPGMAAAISREDAGGEPAGGWHPAEKLTIAQALAAFTTGAAYAGFAEDRVGSLEPGHLADFVLVDRDIMTATPSELRAAQVLETWIGGVRAWVRK